MINRDSNMLKLRLVKTNKIQEREMKTVKGVHVKSIQNSSGHITTNAIAAPQEFKMVTELLRDKGTSFILNLNNCGVLGNINIIFANNGPKGTIVGDLHIGHSTDTLNGDIIIPFTLKSIYSMPHLLLPSCEINDATALNDAAENLFYKNQACVINLRGEYPLYNICLTLHKDGHHAILAELNTNIYV